MSKVGELTPRDWLALFSIHQLGEWPPRFLKRKRARLNAMHLVEGVFDSETPVLTDMGCKLVEENWAKEPWYAERK